MEEPPRFRRCSRKFARAQRRNVTNAETLLWRALRNHRIDGHAFRRQTPIGPYFADFVCLARKIVVEADGRTHETPDAANEDAERDAWLQRAGFRVLRLPDDLVIGGLPILVERIWGCASRRRGAHALPFGPGPYATRWLST
jgi:very-short-patch-repair endonuclease